MHLYHGKTLATRSDAILNKNQYGLVLEIKTAVTFMMDAEAAIYQTVSEKIREQGLRSPRNEAYARYAVE